MDRWTHESVEAHRPARGIGGGEAERQPRAPQVVQAHYDARAPVRSVTEVDPPHPFGVQHPGRHLVAHREEQYDHAPSRIGRERTGPLWIESDLCRLELWMGVSEEASHSICIADRASAPDAEEPDCGENPHEGDDGPDEHAGRISAACPTRPATGPIASPRLPAAVCSPTSQPSNPLRCLPHRASIPFRRSCILLAAC